MEKRVKIVLLTLVLLFGLITYVIVTTFRERETNIGYSFNGVVQKVDYDAKGIPKVTVNGLDFYLAAGYNFEHKIERGDSLIKLQGSNVYKLVKHKTGLIIEFRNQDIQIT